MVAEPHPADVPAGYPRDFERSLRLDDGRQVHIRPIIPADRAQLAAAVLGADAETLRRRFLGGAPAVTDALLTHLTTLDYRRRFALVAADASTGQGVAIARYEETRIHGTAEVAVVVDPGWRRVGLATALIELLAHAGFERGIQAFCATYLAENRPIATLVAHAHGSLTIRQGIAEAAVNLAQMTASDDQPTVGL